MCACPNSNLASLKLMRTRLSNPASLDSFVETIEDALVLCTIVMRNKWHGTADREGMFSAPTLLVDKQLQPMQVWWTRSHPKMLLWMMDEFFHILTGLEEEDTNANMVAAYELFMSSYPVVCAMPWWARLACRKDFQ